MNIAIILGGTIDPERKKAALKREKPRIDVLEMEAMFPAQLFDFGWFQQRAEHEPFTRILYFLARKFGHWSEWLSLRAVWSMRNYDAIYATGEDVGIFTALLLRLFRIQTPRLIVRMESPIFGSTNFRRLVFKAVLRFSARRMNTILNRTQAHVSYLYQQVGLSGTEAFFAPETTDTVFFNCKTPEVKQSTLEFLTGPYLVSAGLEMRDYETLISAVRGLPITALICAGSPWAKVSYSVTEGELPENVIVRSFNALEMRELYRSAAFVVLPIKPTLRACGMNVVLEAWAMGRAVIASQTEGLQSYIEDKTTGYFVTPESVPELRSAIQQLILDPSEAQRLGENGYQKVTQELCMERYIETVWSAIQ